MGQWLRRETYRARQLRVEATAAERALWELLRDRRLAGLKFRRQQPIGLYVADFYCAEARLVVEADGAAHLAREDRDRVRDAVMAACGLVVLRFRNHDILERPRAVLRRIVLEVRRCLGREPPEEDGGR